MKIRKRDLVVRFDDVERAIQFLVPVSTGAAELRVFYEISSGEDFANERGSLEEALGTAILSFLAVTYSSSDFKFDQYRKAARDMQDHIDAVCPPTQRTKYELAMIEVRTSLRQKSKSGLARAEAYLQAAAADGDLRASEYLERVWPALKSRFGI